MRPTQHHPEADDLVALVSGGLDVAARVVLEAHLAFCPACREEVGRLGSPGGRWLEETPVAPAPSTLLEGILARIQAEEGPGSVEPDPWEGVPLPAAARAELPPGLRLRWRPVPLSRASFAPLAKEGDAALILVRLAPDRILPEHVHLGDERLVVLAGGFEDPCGESWPGDHRYYGSGSRHAPRTLRGEDCWIVTRIEGEVRFTGWRGVLGRWAGSLRRRKRRR